MSYQQHIVRQKLARRKMKQIQDALSLVESTRFKGSKPFSSRRMKKDTGISTKLPARSKTYLSQYKPNSSHPTKCVHEPQFLCAVYLHGFRRLKTTFVSFKSFAQLKQCVRAKFGINEVASIYREVTKAITTVSQGNNRKRYVRHLKRIMSLECLTDGDTLCVTQNAYEDMMIQSALIKQQQRVADKFEHKPQQLSTNVPTACSNKDKNQSAQILKTSNNIRNRPQVWDSNGRSIGVKETPLCIELIDEFSPKPAFLDVSVCGSENRSDQVGKLDAIGKQVSQPVLKTPEDAQFFKKVFSKFKTHRATEHRIAQK
ncbi:uncharacterized protein PHALS_01710 [Plasmopara halstedii]|uniref:Uncharacterized protein n=1 Tax=Plasmopara halstedii TaxID=4781 RepID=A0A0P1AXA4_PLAHL|nr:uncharacterized protein PHALS_01710 [Plasmopara halstedii]CEG45412.1 hypothetical protein PHALS_01710 [Plasmopara halstedii]|eukprot:XP_024581781.1 hypothetical protein PHALS_01710 [Plasmopara halstedii]